VRIWREEGLRVPARKRKRRRLGQSTAAGAGRLRATHPGHLWALDFQHDATTDGRELKFLNTAVVGAPSTPTPQGRFFVEESVRMPAGTPGGPFALALSARSNVLQEFEGGPGQIALHGLANLGGRPGTAASHGCVRLANSNIRWMAGRIPPGGGSYRCGGDEVAVARSISSIGFDGVQLEVCGVEDGVGRPCSVAGR